MSNGNDLLEIDREINHYIKTGSYTKPLNLSEQIKLASSCLSKELLYMKFLQGLPIVGAVGGFYDVIYMKNINKYANLKYKRRFLSKR